MDRKRDRHASGADWTCGLLVAIAMIGIVATGTGEAPPDPTALRASQPYRPYASADHGLAQSKQVFDERRARSQRLATPQAGVNLAREDVTTED